MVPSPKRILLAGVAMILMLGACIPAQPTEAPQDNSSEIATSVALTIAAHATQTAAAIPLSSNTPLAAATFAPVKIVTDTPFPSDTPTPTETPYPNDNPDGTDAPTLYGCDVFTQDPDYRAEIKAGTKFQIKWIIVNTGTRPWNAGVDVKYSSGSEMTSVKRVEIPKALQPGERYKLVLDAVAPKQVGLQYMTWTVEGPMCQPTVIISVQ